MRFDYAAREDEPQPVVSSIGRTHTSPQFSPVVVRWGTQSGMDGAQGRGETSLQWAEAIAQQCW